MGQTYLVRWTAPALIAAAILTGSPALAGDGGRVAGGIFGAILKGAMVDSARKSWLQVDQAVLACLIQRHRIDPNALIQQGISATDYRLRNYMNSCQQAVAQEQYQREQAERDRILREEQEQRRLEEERQAQEAQAERDRQEAERARLEQERIAAAQRHEADLRRGQLASQFGAGQAEAIMSGKVAVGMAAAAVLEARGEPSRKESIPPSEELWFYGQERVVLSKGRVTYIGR